MDRKLLKAAIFGGVVAFFWGVFSWHVLPWHQMTMHNFQNEMQVAAAISQNAPTSGVYSLPSEDTPADEARAMPAAMVAVRLQGMGGNMGAPMAAMLITQMVGAFFAAWLLSKTKGLELMQKACFVSGLALFAGIVAKVPASIWMGHHASFTVVCILDLMIGWFLAGLAIAKVSKK